MVNNLQVHQRHILLFLYEKNPKVSGSEAARQLNDVFGDESLSERSCREWLGRFKRGEKGIDDLEDESREGRPTHFDEDRLRDAVEENPRLTVREMACIFNCSVGNIFNHLRAIGKVSKLGRWVPHRLSIQNKLDRVRIAKELLDRYEKGLLKLDDILTSDEKWVLYLNIVRHREWVDKGSPASATAKPGLHPLKVMLCVWWDSEGIVHWELLAKGVTITADLYTDQLERVQEALKENRPHRVKTLLLHDNATPHTARMTKAKIAELDWDVLPHPPYSPDMAPTDFKLFRSLQNHLNGKEFQSEEEIRLFIEEFFKSKASGFYVRGFTDLVERWKAVIDCEGEYPPD